MKKKKTMNDVYGDGSDHFVCMKCGFCITCGDCEEHGEHKQNLLAHSREK